MVDLDKTQSERIVRIWDNPLARIHYLETVLADKEWEAIIYQPEFDPNGEFKNDAPAILQELKEKLEGRGYAATLATDENGIPVLRVKNFGAEMNVAKALEELGMVKGMAYSFTHFNQSFGKTIKDTVDYFKTIARDKARFIGGVYLVGDLLLALAAKFDGSGKKEEVKLNIKESKFKDSMFAAAGVGATLQSLAFLGFAKDQNVEQHNKLESKMEQLLAKGDVLDDKSWRYKIDESPKTKGLLSPVKKHPIQFGALMQVLGQVGLISSAVIGLQQHKPFVEGNKPSIREMLAGMKMKEGGTIGERDKYQSKAISKIAGSWLDILTGIFSSVSWGLMTKTKPNTYEKEELASWASPQRWWQEVMQAPNKLASVLAFGATTTGMAAGWAKGNKMQAAANVTYLAGDAVIWMLESESYGQGQGGHKEKAEVLAQSVQKIMDNMPLVLGREEQGQLADNMVQYSAAKLLHEECVGNKSRLPTEEQVNTLAAHVKEKLQETLPERHPGVEKLAVAITALAARFGENEQEMRNALCEQVATLPAVHISATELAEVVAQQPEPEKKDIAANVTEMKNELAGLLATIPSGAQAGMADTIYNVVEKHTPVPEDKRIELTDYTVDKAFNEIVAAAGKHHGKSEEAGEGTHIGRLATERAASAMRTPDQLVGGRS